MTYDLAVFAALGWERRAAMAGVIASAAEPRPRTWSGRLRNGASCVLVQTGIGPDRAGRAARQAPAARAFLACGCAAAVVDWLATGDVVCASDVVVLNDDLDAVGTVPATSGTLAPWATERGARAHAGTIAASPIVLADPESKRRVARLGAVAVEMEGGAIGQVARERGVPFASVQVVLDVASQALALPADVVDETTGEVRFARAVVRSLPPWRWRGAARLARQVRLAERNLQRFLALLFDGDGLAVLR